MVIAPPRPLLATPVPIKIAPLFPEVACPVLNIITPLTPFVFDREVRNSIAPLDPVVLPVPLAITMSPPAPPLDGPPDNIN
jgi:hypothetical protein